MQCYRIYACIQNDIRPSGSRKPMQNASRLWRRSCVKACWRLSGDWFSRNMNACNRKEASIMLLTKKIKLEVSSEDAQAFEFMQAKCRGLFNWWVMRLRNGEKWNFAEAKRSLQESRK